MSETPLSSSPPSPSKPFSLRPRLSQPMRHTTCHPSFPPLSSSSPSRLPPPPLLLLPFSFVASSHLPPLLAGGPSTFPASLPTSANPSPFRLPPPAGDSSSPPLLPRFDPSSSPTSADPLPISPASPSPANPPLHLPLPCSNLSSPQASASPTLSPSPSLCRSPPALSLTFPSPPPLPSPPLPCSDECPPPLELLFSSWSFPLLYSNLSSSPASTSLTLSSSPSLCRSPPTLSPTFPSPPPLPCSVVSPPPLELTFSSWSLPLLCSYLSSSPASTSPTLSPSPSLRRSPPTSPRSSLLLFPFPAVSDPIPLSKSPSPLGHFPSPSPTSPPRRPRPSQLSPPPPPCADLLQPLPDLPLSSPSHARYPSRVGCPFSC